jgi:hypothetical protein
MLFSSTFVRYYLQSGTAICPQIYNYVDVRFTLRYCKHIEVYLEYRIYNITLWPSGLTVAFFSTTFYNVVLTLLYCFQHKAHTVITRVVLTSVWFLFKQHLDTCITLIQGSLISYQNTSARFLVLYLYNIIYYCYEHL